MTSLGRRSVVAVGIAAVGVLVFLVLLRRSPKSDLDRLQDSGVLRIGVSDDYPPFASIDHGVRRGLDVEIAERLARDLNLELTWVHFAWQKLSADMTAGRFDIALSGVTVRPERVLIGRFSRPYALTGAVALIRAADADRLRGLAELDHAGIRIAVNRGGHLERIARRRFSQAVIVTLDDNRALAQAVLSGTTDAAISDDAEARGLLRPELKMLGPFTNDAKAVWFRAGTPELAAWVNHWLVAREHDGWLPALRQRFLGASPSASAMDGEVVATSIRLRMQLMPWVGAVKAKLGLPIRDPAQETRVLARVSKGAESEGLDPQSVRDLYGVLMMSARGIEHASGVGVAEPLPSLDTLRGALGDIDRELCAELRVALDSDPHRDWGAQLGPRNAPESIDHYPAVLEDALKRVHKAR